MVWSLFLFAQLGIALPPLSCPRGHRAGLGPSEWWPSLLSATLSNPFISPSAKLYKNNSFLPALIFLSELQVPACSPFNLPQFLAQQGPALGP